MDNLVIIFPLLIFLLKKYFCFNNLTMVLLRIAGLTFCRCRYISSSTKVKPKIDSKSRWQSVIGLEIHAQIQSESKLFSGASSKFGGQVNQQVDILDVAMPGTLPVLNVRCVEAGVLTALALKCHINMVSKFDRKHYFYADLPAGYQITQQRAPLGVGGELSYLLYHPSGGIPTPLPRKARLTQLQLEQDSGKSLHDDAENISLIDLNRAGVALMEIVTEPDFTTGEDAAAFIKELQRILQTLGTCNGKMEEGSLRVDASVSLHLPGEPYGVRSECKNINSVRNVQKAVDYEIARQTEILDGGGSIVNETRMFDAVTGTTVSLRDKEALHDYRFMPEPNLPPLRLYTHATLPPAHDRFMSEPNLPPLRLYTHATLPSARDLSCVVNVDALAERLPRLPDAQRQWLCEVYGLTLHQAMVIVNRSLEEMFESIIRGSERDAKAVAIFLTRNFLGFLNNEKISIEECKIEPHHLGDLIDLLKSDLILPNVPKQVLPLLQQNPELSVRDALEQHDWWQITDRDQIAQVCQAVIDANPNAVQKYKSGKKKVLNFFIGQVMKNTQWKAKEKTVTDLFEKLLS